MEKNCGRKNHFGVGLTVLATAACICVKGLRRGESNVKQTEEKKA